METGDASSSPPDATSSSADDPAAAASPSVPQTILSQAVQAAIGQTDAKLAFDMLLVHEHINAQDTAHRLLQRDAAFLKQTLASQTREQSDMFQHFHEKTDAHLARITELERALETAQAQREQDAATAQETLEIEHQAWGNERQEAQDVILVLREELRRVQAFAVAKHELEARTQGLETALETQRAAFQTQLQEAERNQLMEQARAKHELLARVQAAKTELLRRTDDQLAATTQRTLLENAHCTQELAFQSREAERLLSRLDRSEQQMAAIRAQNQVLEANERLLAKKNRYYQKLLAKLQPMDGDETPTGALQLAIGPSDDTGEQIRQDQTMSELESERKEIDTLKRKLQEMETQLQRAREWLRVFQGERQFLIAQQDEVVQFLCRALDEAAMETQQRGGGGGEATPSGPDVDAMETTSDRIEELLLKAPSTTTMTAFGRRVLGSRPALDDLSSADVREVLRFLLEKMRLYQTQVAAVYRPSDCGHTKPSSELLERQLGVELPPIVNAGGLSPSPLQQKRRVFAHVTAAVEASSSLSKAKNAATLSLVSPQKLRLAGQPPHAPVSPQLMAMATNHFNFLNVKPKSPVKKTQQQRPQDLTGKPTRQTQRQEELTPSSSATELLGPWPGTASEASLAEWAG
ncbi:hypothetical protein BBJ28_00022656 [Nothophytophthora sp. Chile5]|nr:hypothetical protein BBJ28_00022656 [Nothophytophthora sp. Chile5]